jgi:GNAT superfamily N-acetyltransferase
MTVDAPAGLRIRPYAGDADIPALVGVVNAEHEADGVDERETAEGWRAWLSNPSDSFTPTRDLALAELDGQVVAMASQDWADSRDGSSRDYRLWGAVHPAHRRRGIGRALLADNERRARALAATHPRDRPPVLYGFAADGRPGGILLERAGYAVARWFLDMVRPTLDAIDDVPLPDGFELRPVTPDQHVALWRANREAFRDHWGGADESEGAMRRFFESPDADPTLWLIAWDGDEIAGGVINGIRREENEALGIQRGWLESVFTRRPWRRRGLARALIARSLLLLRERGMTSAGLGVDAENPSGALGLYEEAGFGVHERFVAWRKPMELPEGLP